MGCHQSKDENEPQRVVSFIGLDNSGKSRIIYYLANNYSFNGYVPFSTPGVNYFEIPPLKIYDVGGLGRYRDQWESYIRQSDGIIFVVDSTDKERICCVKEEIEKVFSLCSELKIPLLILLNKTDLEHQIQKQDIEQITQISQQNIVYNILETSAQTGEGLIDGRQWILQNIRLPY